MKRSGLPKHVTCFLDRHGKRRYRARRQGVTYYFKSGPGADEFLIEYQRWLAGEREVGSDRMVSGSVSALVAKFYRSAEWSTLSDATKNTYRSILERFRSDHGDKPVKMLERKHVRDIIAARANTPAAANNEGGCSPHQIASVTGHKTLKEVERYTKAANQEQLAQDAMQAISGTAKRLTSRRLAKKEV
jgi:hypothetical protein